MRISAQVRAAQRRLRLHFGVKGSAAAGPPRHRRGSRSFPGRLQTGSKMAADARAGEQVSAAAASPPPAPRRSPPTRPALRPPLARPLAASPPTQRPRPGSAAGGAGLAPSLCRPGARRRVASSVLQAERGPARVLPRRRKELASPARPGSAGRPRHPRPACGGSGRLGFPEAAALGGKDLAGSRRAPELPGSGGERAGAGGEGGSRGGGQ